jgi:hypothetical protein
MNARRKVIEILEERRLPFVPEQIDWIIRRYGIEVDGGDFEAFAEGILAEGVRRSLEVAERLFDNLGIQSLPPEVEERLQKGEIVQVRFYEKGNVTFLVGRDGRIEKFVDLSLPRGREVPLGVDIDIEPGLVVLRAENSLEAVRGRVFFRDYSEKALERVLDGLRPLASFLPAMELEDLPQALERLGALDVWESRVEGPYVLARSASAWTLRRGPVFGDPELDGALLCEDEVILRFPEGVDLSFSFFFEVDMALITHLEIAWEGEVVDLDEALSGDRKFWGHPLDRDFVAETIRDLLSHELYLLEKRNRTPAFEEDPPVLLGASPRMLALLKVLAYHEDPFGLLAEGRVSRYATAELFTEL